MPESRKRSLKKKVDFNKRVTIKDLLEETGIKDMGRNLTTEYVISLADTSLNKKSMDAFLDYLEDDHIINVFQKVSAKKFLELLSLFESERFQRIYEWADECLMSDSIADFKKYCEELGYNWETRSISRKKFEELLKSKETHDLEKDGLLS
ncbi:hypothetical protein J6T66_01840 [bacterium]|nr:hypothetical protein [bacterium]